MERWKYLNSIVDRLSIPAKVIGVAVSLCLAYEMAIHLAQPLTRLAAIGVLGLVEQEVPEVNTNYLSLHQQIDLATRAAEAEGVHVTYQKSELDLTTQQIATTGFLLTKHEIGEVVRTGEFRGEYLKFMTQSVIQEQLQKESPEFVATIFGYGSTFDNFSAMSTIPGSGFHERMTPEQDMREFREYILKEVELNDYMSIQPWKTLTYWIMKNNGNLAAALHDNAIAWKAMTTNNRQGEFIVANTTERDESVLYVIENFQDQSSLSTNYLDTYNGYGSYDTDYNHSTFEQIRINYDNYIMAALLDRFPPAVVVTMSEVQEYSELRRLGNETIAANITSGIGLYELAEYLESFPSK